MPSTNPQVTYSASKDRLRSSYEVGLYITVKGGQVQGLREIEELVFGSYDGYMEYWGSLQEEAGEDVPVHINIERLFFENTSFTGSFSLDCNAIQPYGHANVDFSRCTFSPGTVLTFLEVGQIYSWDLLDFTNHEGKLLLNPLPEEVKTSSRTSVRLYSGGQTYLEVYNGCHGLVVSTEEVKLLQDCPW